MPPVENAAYTNVEIADPRVMEHFPALLSKDESDALADRIQAHIGHYGWGLWAVEVPGVATFAGYIGLAEPGFKAHFTPCIEVGWRLAADFWGRGYATEGARALVRVAFEEFDAARVYAETMTVNTRSRRVMEKAGLSYVRTFFADWPEVIEGSEHGDVEYAVNKENWALGGSP